MCGKEKKFPERTTHKLIKSDVGQMEHISRARIRKFWALTYSMMITLMMGDQMPLVQRADLSVHGSTLTDESCCVR